MNRNLNIAAAIAAVLGTAAGVGSAVAQPTITSAAAPDVAFYISGSSAATNAVLGAIQTNLCGGAANALTVTGNPNGNFYAVSCVPASGVASANGTDVYTIFYRNEGGSVTGALPIVNNKTINQLDLTNTSAISLTTCVSGSTACTETVNGVSASNGTDDSFSGGVTKEATDLGIMDVEPAALTGNNYPTPYSTTVWGPINQAGLQGLTGYPLFDEVYALYVNTGGSTAWGSGEVPIKISKAMASQILQKLVTNWSLVTDVNGNPVATSSLAISLVNREQGSGSRAATDLLITGDTCQTAGAALGTTAVGYFSTGNVLSAASTKAGAITYATIDQSKTNMTQVWLNGIQPSNAAAAAGQYDFWVEATVATNSNVTLTTKQSNLLTFLTSQMQAVGTAPHLADVNAIPGIAGNTAAVSIGSTANNATGSLSGLGSSTIYINPFTRGQVTCNQPSYVP